MTMPPCRLIRHDKFPKIEELDEERGEGREMEEMKKDRKTNLQIIL